MASLAPWIVRGIDKNCARRSLELQLHDNFFVQGPYEMRLTCRYYGECSDLSNFRIGSIEFFALAVVNLAAKNCRIFSVWMPVRSRHVKSRGRAAGVRGVCPDAVRT